MQQTGVRMQHVQYKGGSQATTDLLAGTIDAHMMSSAVGAGQAENPSAEDAGGREQAAAAAHRRGADHGGGGRCRASTRPRGWRVFAAPGLPEPIRERIARELVAIAQRPGLSGEVPQHRLRAAGLDAADDRAFYRDEVARWTAFIKERGLMEKPQ